MAWDQVWCEDGHMRHLVPSEDGYTEMGDACRIVGCQKKITYMTLVSRGSYHGYVIPVLKEAGAHEEAKRMRAEASKLSDKARSLRRELRSLESKISSLNKEAGLVVQYQVPDAKTSKMIIDEDHPRYREWQKTYGEKRDLLFPKILKPIDLETD